MVDQAKAALLSIAPPDIVLDVTPFEVSVPGAGTYSFDMVTDIPSMCMFQGRFGVDGSAQYQDLGGAQLVGGVTFQVLVKTSPNKVTLFVNNGHAGAHSVQAHVVLIARKDQGLVPLPKNISNINFFDTRLNYSKIYKEDRQPVVVAGGGTATTPAMTFVAVPHTLGIFPTARVFLDNGTDMIDATANNSIALLFGGSLYSTVRVSTTEVTTEFSNQGAPGFNYNLSTRIYHDPS